MHFFMMFKLIYLLCNWFKTAIMMLSVSGTLHLNIKLLSSNCKSFPILGTKPSLIFMIPEKLAITSKLTEKDFSISLYVTLLLMVKRTGGNSSVKHEPHSCLKYTSRMCGSIMIKLEGLRHLIFERQYFNFCKGHILKEGKSTRLPMLSFAVLGSQTSTYKDTWMKYHFPFENLLWVITFYGATVDHSSSFLQIICLKVQFREYTA